MAAEGDKFSYSSPPHSNLLPENFVPSPTSAKSAPPPHVKSFLMPSVLVLLLQVTNWVPLKTIYKDPSANAERTSG